MILLSARLWYQEKKQRYKQDKYARCNSSCVSIWQNDKIECYRTPQPKDKQDDINKINETSLMHVSCIDEKHGKELDRLINSHEKSIVQFKENISCLNKGKSELALALEKAQAEIKDLQINRN